MSNDQHRTSPGGPPPDDDPLATFGSEGTWSGQATGVSSAASSARGVSQPASPLLTSEPLSDTGLDAFAPQLEPGEPASTPSPLLPRTVPAAPRTPMSPRVATPPRRSFPPWVGIASALVMGVSAGLFYARYLSPPTTVSERPPAGVVPNATPTPRDEPAAQPVLEPPARPAAPGLVAPLPTTTTVPVQRAEGRPRVGAPSRGTADALSGGALTSIAMPVVESPSPVSAGESVVASPPIDLVEGHAESPDDTARIRAVLDLYRRAYEELDPVSTAAVYPGVDTRALARAFGTLSRQSVSFRRCDIEVTGTRATALCEGGIEYVRRVGDAEPQSRGIAWSFALDQRAGQWRIGNVSAR